MLITWFMAEIGRQPWIVQGLQKVNEAVSPSVPAGAVLASMIVFTLIYGVLAVVDLYLLTKSIKHGPEETLAVHSLEPAEGVSLWT